MNYDVVICTFNGEHHVVEQLDSILNQAIPPTRIIVSDDGSDDATCALVTQRAETCATPISLLQGPRQGVNRNLLFALSHTQSPYVFIADQDDIWLDNKSTLFSQQMTDEATPHLIFSDAWVWQPPATPQQTLWQMDQLDPGNIDAPQRLAFHNCVQGASAAINRALINKLSHHPDMVMYDWWIALLAATQGRASAISTPTLYYRQHRAAQLGSQALRHSQQGYWQSRWGKIQASQAIIKQAAAFGDVYQAQLTPQDHAFFCGLAAALQGSYWQKIKFLASQRPYRKSLLRSATLWLAILSTGPTSQDTRFPPSRE
ncbi:glycosyltransferase [Gilvimarinus agarilyticus]|uniref:glycosyltransferase n=1 Tax=Gilvimarinus agarilyticus TaxID=679259 RepID=UPI0006971EF1|nr:glycosyltransferase [Gilvimarinus agarilyticus]